MQCADVLGTTAGRLSALQLLSTIIDADVNTLLDAQLAMDLQQAAARLFYNVLIVVTEPEDVEKILRVVPVLRRRPAEPLVAGRILKGLCLLFTLNEGTEIPKKLCACEELRACVCELIDEEPVANEAAQLISYLFEE